ncbi:MAG: hypothetical protein AB9856_20250 [Cellulosilyticaceae bacterium]
MNDTELKLYHSRNRLFFLWIFTTNLLAFFFCWLILMAEYGTRYPVFHNIPIFILQIGLIFTPILATLFLLKTKLYPIKQRLTAIVIGICSILSMVILIFLFCFPPIKSATSEITNYMLLDYDVGLYWECLDELIPCPRPREAQNVSYQYSYDATVLGFDSEITTKWCLPEKEFLYLEKQIAANPRYKKEGENKWQFEPSSPYYHNKVSGFVKLDKNNSQVEYFAKVSEH